MKDTSTAIDGFVFDFVMKIGIFCEENYNHSPNPEITANMARELFTSHKQQIKKDCLKAFRKMLPEKKQNYNLAKKSNCEYCGTPEGSYHKAGCEALFESLRNEAIDEILTALDAWEKEIYL